MTGRPRKRSIDETLELAMHAFWQRGYASTSISDLSKILGVGPSSLYNTFGSKAQLYLQCIDAYAKANHQFSTESLAHPNVKVGLVSMLERAAIKYTRPDCPAGCAVLSQPNLADDEVEPAIRERRQRLRQSIRDRISAAVDAGDLADNTDADAVARFVAGTLQGLSQQARDGATGPELTAMVQVAARAIRSL